MSRSDAFHLSTVAAESYERQRVPAIFGPMAEATLDAVSLPQARTVLDVACGTGVMARAVGRRLTAPARIVGCDLNPAMIEVARAHTPDGPHRHEWHAAPADAMPLEDGEVDLAFCQHGLQFFPDKPAPWAKSAEH
jgi:ubiquinone/menaquinone biosynthesis C-methylase UbiE